MYEKQSDVPWNRNRSDELERLPDDWDRDGDAPEEALTFLQRLDEALHRLDDIKALDWFTDSELRYRFCQWAWR